MIGDLNVDVASSPVTNVWSQQPEVFEGVSDKQAVADLINDFGDVIAGCCTSSWR